MSQSVPPPGFQPERTYTEGLPGVVPVASSALAPTAAPAFVERRSRGGLRPRRSKLIAGGALLAAAVAAAFVLLGSTSSPVADPVAQAATLSSGTPGYRLNMQITMSAPSLSSPITAYGHAIVNLRQQSMSMSFAIDMSQLPQAAQVLGGSTMRMDMILTHGVMYMRLPAALTQHVPQFGGKQWLKLDLSKLVGLPGFSSLGSNPTMTDPSHMLQYLRAASDSVTNEGSQLVGGVATTHYHVLLDLNNIAANLPATERSTVQSALSQLKSSTNLSQIPMDVWIDAHHLVRRIAMAVTASAGTGAGLQENMTADLTDYGPQPTPSAPPADQVQDLSNLVHVHF